MRIEQLYYCLELAKTHSFSIAAANLFISQSTLSESVKKLEDELGAALFRRAKGGAYLTDVGEEILEIAKQITGLSEQAQRIARQAAQTTASTIRDSLHISVSVGIIHAYLAPALLQFQQAYPHVTFDVIERGFHTLLDMVQNQQCDLAITVTDQTDYWITSKPQLIYKCLTTESFYALVNTNSPLAAKNSLTIRELTRYPIATLGFRDTPDDVRDTPLNGMLNASSDTFQIVLTTNNLQLLFDYLLHHEAIGFPMTFPVLDALPKTDKLTAVKITDSFKAKLYYLYRADHPKRPLIEAFLQTVQKNI